MMDIKNKIWMTGNLDWFAYIGEEEVWLGRREVPIPLEEGDGWTNELGLVFKVIDKEIVIVDRVEPPNKFW